MNLIKQSWEIKEYGYSIKDIYNHIEWCGRHCYKSHNKITEGSSETFVNKMIDSKHGAMLEHGTIYLSIPITEWDDLEEYNNDYLHNSYSKINDSQVNWENWTGNVYITTNLRVLVGHNSLEDLKYLCEPTEYHEKRITVKFITDQGILREFTRHRIFSFAVESTRYCNYSLNKFNKNITFIWPNWFDDNQLGEIDSYKILNQLKNIDLYTFNKEDRTELMFLSTLANSEIQYMNLIENGWSPQKARNILPLATKCELIMTGYVSDWKEFFKLRALGTTGKPHPQAEELATTLLNEFLNKQLIIDCN